MKTIGKIKHIASLLALVVLCLTACGSSFEGEALVVSARERYAGLESAYVKVTDSVTSEITQAFTFRYEGDLLTYLYVATDGETVYAEYHNGYQLHYRYTEDKDWTILSGSDPNYTTYTKANKHPMADRRLFFYEPQSINSSKVVSMNEAHQVTLGYDVARLSKTVAEQLSLIGELSKFSTILLINTDGYPEAMQQTGTLDGEYFSYEIRIESMNKIPVIEKPLL